MTGSLKLDNLGVYLVTGLSMILLT